MMKRNLELIFIALALAFGLTAAAGTARAQSSSSSGAELREEFHQTYPLSSAGRFSLENVNGSVRITGWDRNEVRVDAVKRAYTRERLNEAQIMVEAGTEAVHVRTKYPDQNMNFYGDEGRRHNNPATVDYTLSIPRGARIETIELVNGSIEIAGVSNTVVASSVNGAVRARNLMGEARLSTVNGPVEAYFDRLNDARSISLNSVNGPLMLTIPSDANAQVKANTLSGRITNDYGLPVHDGEYVGHDLAGVIGNGGTRIRLNNVNGSVQIRRASDNRPLSPATSLLTEKIKDKEKDRADKEMAKEAAREARRSAVRVQVDTERINREVNERVQRDMERMRVREAERAARTAERDRHREARESEVNVNINGNSHLRFIDRESKSFPVSGTPRVIVKTFDGPVMVRSWDRQEVMYTAIKRAGTEDELQGTRVRAQADGSSVQIVAEFDRAAARRIAPGVTNVSATVNLEVFVPRNASVNASSGDGRLYVEGVRGDLNLHTGDGAIDVRDAGGRLTARTGDGRIRIASFDGEADVNTGDGAISLDGRFMQLNARTGDGAISLAVPAGVNATVETDADHVENDGLAMSADSTTDEDRVRRWTIGGGGPLFRLRTGDGRVTLRRAN